MGKICIDLSLSNIWRSWYLFEKGKKKTFQLEKFQYYLEDNLINLYDQLSSGTYKHGGFRSFTVSDSKRRNIAVASISDRVVHRLIYEYLVDLFDKTFIFDAWSCRKNKGICGAIQRTHFFMKKYKTGFVWRSDIRKFFDSVNQNNLKQFLFRKVKCVRAQQLLCEVIESFPSNMPIGNLTSQIFANIYLNELDRYIKFELRIKGYLRYGDDFVVFDKNRFNLLRNRDKITNFLMFNLKLEVNKKSDFLVKTKQGIKFLGVEIFDLGIRLNKRNNFRIIERLERKNIASYCGIAKRCGNKNTKKIVNWKILEILENMEKML